MTDGENPSPPSEVGWTSLDRPDQFPSLPSSSRAQSFISPKFNTSDGQSFAQAVKGRPTSEQTQDALQTSHEEDYRFAEISNLKPISLLNGSLNLSLFDHKHLVIECSCSSDFFRLWLKLVWYIEGFAMRMFKWETVFSPLKESSIAPVWVRFEGIPFHLFDEMPLWSIANSIGKPIKVDQRNINRSKLNSARVCVELDVTKSLVDSIWVSIIDDVTGIEVEGFSVSVFADVIPDYCVKCFHIGHGVESCKMDKACDFTNPNNSSIGNTEVEPVFKTKSKKTNEPQVWKAVGKGISTVGTQINPKLSNHYAQNRFEALNNQEEHVNVASRGIKDRESSKQSVMVGGKPEQELAARIKQANVVANQLGPDEIVARKDKGKAAQIDIDMQIVPWLQEESSSSAKYTDITTIEAVEQGRSEAATEVKLCDASTVTAANLETVGKEDSKPSDVLPYEPNLQLAIILDTGANSSEGVMFSSSSEQISKVQALNPQAKPFLTRQVTTSEAADFAPVLQQTVVALVEDSRQIEEAQKEDLDAELAASQLTPSYPGSNIMVKPLDNSSCNTSELVSAQGWQVVSNKNNRARAIVTRSQMKVATTTWADQVEEEQMNSKAPTKKAKKLLERQMNKLSSRLNNMGSKHVMRSQLEAELEVLHKEYTRWF